MPLSHVIKAIHNAFGSTLLSPEFMDKFYSVFFVLSPESEKRFPDIEKQKKALHGMLKTLEKIAEDKDVFLRVEEIKEKHKLMKITSDEFSAFCNALIITLKWANKSNSEENQKMLSLTAEKVKLLETFMSSNEQEKCCIL